MIKATDRAWPSAGYFGLARRLEALSNGRRLAVLDLGCGDGSLIEFLTELGHVACGCDFPRREAELRERLSGPLGAGYNDHIRLTEDEGSIPFEDNRFDVIVALSVFEHIRLFDTMMGECARVLKPTGALFAAFPLALAPIERHLHVPFAHWLPPGRLRIGYLQALCTLGVLTKAPNMSPRETAIFLDRYLRNETYYRFINEILSVGTYYFDNCELTIESSISTKKEFALLERDPRKRRLTLLKANIQLGMLQYFGQEFVGSIFNAPFLFTGPRKQRRPQRRDEQFCIEEA